MIFPFGMRVERVIHRASASPAVHLAIAYDAVYPVQGFCDGDGGGSALMDVARRRQVQRVGVQHLTQNRARSIFRIWSAICRMVKANDLSCEMVSALPGFCPIFALVSPAIRLRSRVSNISSNDGHRCLREMFSRVLRGAWTEHIYSSMPNVKGRVTGKRESE